MKVEERLTRDVVHEARRQLIWKTFSEMTKRQPIEFTRLSMAVNQTKITTINSSMSELSTRAQLMSNSVLRSLSRTWMHSPMPSRNQITNYHLTRTVSTTAVNYSMAIALPLNLGILRLMHSSPID